MSKNITGIVASIDQTVWTKVASMTDEDIIFDDENPEWTDEMFASAVRVDALPTSLLAKLKRSQK
jgi:hypothetical protein